jgi:hypothetical protein
MKNKNKTLLNEGTVRRFMALAGVESLVNPFLKKVNEEATLQTEIEATLGAASDAKMGGALPPAPEEEPAPIEEEALDEYGTGPGGAPDIGGKAPGEGPVGEAPEEGQPTMEEAEELEEGDVRIPGVTYQAPKGGKYDPAKRQSLPAPGEEESTSPPPSRTLAESILRHIPNLEIVNDEPSLKTQRRSDILSEVTKRVKQLLSK